LVAVGVRSEIKARLDVVLLAGLYELLHNVHLLAALPVCVVTARISQNTGFIHRLLV
jgi:hypothetical protein